MGVNIAEAVNYADDEFDTEGYTTCKPGCGTSARTSITTDDLSMLSGSSDEENAEPVVPMNTASSATTVPQKRQAGRLSNEMLRRPPPEMRHPRATHTLGINMADAPRGTSSSEPKGKDHESSSSNNKGKGHASGADNATEVVPANPKLIAR
ncbi:hypothetical protein MMC18_003908 [Xylographa bjoerkii]|nr:hypothetical protein [Xylographa bjoerkii]